MEAFFNPVIFLSFGDEKEISKSLKIKALESVLDAPFELYTGENGKPLVKYKKSVGISVSHSKGAVAVIVTPFEPIGIDLEEIKDEYPTRVKDRFFTENERQTVKSPSDFYSVWCKKESYVKMTGEGIAGISDFDSSKTDVIFTDMSDEISKISGKKYSFFLCSKKRIYPEITVL